jgi:hypothetical protein
MSAALSESCSRWSREYGRIFVGLVLLQVLTYGYLLTSLLFTNHTFPNSFVFPYPSFKTLGEGRWLADLIIRVQGGSGVQPFQMAVAIAVQSVNGILFARFVGLERHLDVFLVGAALCLYPAFLDYYSFAMDHITFTLGDMFVLVAMLFCKRAPSVKQALLCCLLFVLALACHQSKIGLMGFGCICYVAMHITGTDVDRPFSVKGTALSIVYIACVFGGACVAYLLSTKLTITFDIGERTYLNSGPEMLDAAVASYGRFVRYHTVGADYLPRALRFLPALGIALGCLAMLHKAYTRHVAAAAIVTVLLLLVPPAAGALEIINRKSWPNAGRIVFVYGYALMFFLGYALLVRRMRTIALGILATSLYCFVVLGTQEANAAAFKTVYDLGMINRIASRIESVAEDLHQKQYALVVAGHYPDFPRSKYVRVPNKSNHAQLQIFTFAVYRQTEILNYVLGRDALGTPSAAQVGRALMSAQGRQPWPARESVYVLDDIVVVLLEKYRADMPHTWTTEQRRRR